MCKWGQFFFCKCQFGTVYHILSKTCTHLWIEFITVFCLCCALHETRWYLTPLQWTFPALMLMQWQRRSSLLLHSVPHALYDQEFIPLPYRRINTNLIAGCLNLVAFISCVQAVMYTHTYTRAYISATYHFAFVRLCVSMAIVCLVLRMYVWCYHGNHVLPYANPSVVSGKLIVSRYVAESITT